MKDFKFLTNDNQLDAQEEWYRRRDNLIQSIENQYGNQINERELILKMRRDYQRWREEYHEPKLNILQRVIKFLKKIW